MRQGSPKLGCRRRSAAAFDAFIGSAAAAVDSTAACSSSADRRLSRKATVPSTYGFQRNGAAASAACGRTWRARSRWRRRCRRPRPASAPGAIGRRRSRRDGRRGRARAGSRPARSSPRRAAVASLARRPGRSDRAAAPCRCARAAPLLCAVGGRARRAGRRAADDRQRDVEPTGRRERAREACARWPRAYFTPSSWTSNTSVAFGGITPPAPRAP